LSEAAMLLGSSPPALSRAIKLLEAAAGAPLFSRKGRRLRLNARGRRLLHHLRDAMRLIDDGLATETRRVRVAAPPFLVGAIPGAVEHGGDVCDDLLTGKIDVAVTLQRAPSDDVVDEALGTLHAATPGGRHVAALVIYAWRRRRLGGAPAPEEATIAALKSIVIGVVAIEPAP
jgi:hypothetical protein